MGTRGGETQDTERHSLTRTSEKLCKDCFCFFYHANFCKTAFISNVRVEPALPREDFNVLSVPLALNIFTPLKDIV